MEYGEIITIGCYANENLDLHFKASYRGEDEDGKILYTRASESKYCKKLDYDFQISDCREIK